MAPRKSATHTAARERARRAAAEAMTRQQRLLELGEEFFLAQHEAEQILAVAEQRIAEIRTHAQQDAAKARQAQAQVVAAMKDEQAGLPEIGQRLELSTAQVRTLLKETSAGTSASTDGATAGDEPVAGDEMQAAQAEAVSV
ncbi:hypothetical protein [Kocuria sabuli]|uniref:hypothetical protein n=1 Tax=Kocuria sabuli TaxID=3071448 RepID=UPI0034D54413